MYSCICLLDLLHRSLYKNFRKGPAFRLCCMQFSRIFSSTPGAASIELYCTPSRYGSPRDTWTSASPYRRMILLFYIICRRQDEMEVSSSLSVRFACRRIIWKNHFDSPSRVFFPEDTRYIRDVALDTTFMRGCFAMEQVMDARQG